MFSDVLINCENKLQAQQIILNDPIGYRFTILWLLWFGAWTEESKKIELPSLFKQYFNLLIFAEREKTFSIDEVVNKLSAITYSGLSSFARLSNGKAFCKLSACKFMWSHSCFLRSFSSSNFYLLLFRVNSYKNMFMIQCSVHARWLGFLLIIATIWTIFQAFDYQQPLLWFNLAEP